MDKTEKQATGWGIEGKLTLKWKERIKLVSLILMISSGAIISFGIGDSVNTHDIREEKIMNELIGLYLSEENAYQYTHRLRAFSTGFLGNIETSCILIPSNLNIDNSSLLHFSFLLVDKTSKTVADNITISSSLLFQLNELNSGIVLEAKGDPGKFELQVIETGKVITGQLEFQFIVNARIFSPSVEYLSTALSLLLTGIVLSLLGSTNWIIKRVILTIIGLSGMSVGSLLIRSSINLYSFYYVPYIGSTAILFLLCLVIVIKSFSLELQIRNDRSLGD